MSWSRSGTIVRRLPLTRSRLSSLSTLGRNTRQETQMELCEDLQLPSSLPYSSCNSSCRRSWGSSVFFSTAPSTDFYEDEEYYNENSGENRSFIISSRAEALRNSSTNTRLDAVYEQSTIDRLVGIGEYQSVDVDSVMTEDYLQRLVDDHISHNSIPPNPNMLLNMLELLHNEEAHISNEILLKIFREVVRSKRVKLLERAEEVVVKNRYDPRLLRMLVTGYINAGAPRRACKLLMEWSNESIRYQPGIESYRRVLTELGQPSNFWDKNGNSDREEKAETQSRKQFNGSGDKGLNTSVTSDVQAEESVLDSNHHLAHRLLQHMCRTHLEFPELPLAPDRDCFHQVLSTCSSIDSLSRAKDILEEMSQFSALNARRRGHSIKASQSSTETPASFDTHPNLSTIRLLVNVWGNTSTGYKKAIEMQKEAFDFLRRIEAEALSQRRRQHSDSSSSTLSSTIVDIKCYNVLLNRLAELGQYEITEKLFLRLMTDYLKGESEIQPDMVTLNTVLKSHVQAHTKTAAVSAGRFLDRLDEFYEHQEQIRKKKRSVVDDDYDDTPRILYNIEPTARARSIISNLWVKLGQPRRAIEILTKAELVYNEKEKHLIQLQRQHIETAHSYSTDTIKRFRPDQISYRQIIGGLCKLQNPPTSVLATEAEEIGERMCKMGHRLNLLTCNTILNCWSKSGNPDRAEIYLEETMQKHDVVPDTVSYNTIIHGHAKLGNLERALELLGRLLEDSLANCRPKDKSKHRTSIYPKPNVRTFTNIIIALSKENTIKAAEEAESLLLRMQELNEPPYNLDTRPNSITYNAVMNCWASLSRPSSRRQRKRQTDKTNNAANGDTNRFDDDNAHHRFGRKAEFVLRSMQGLGRNERPNAISYNTVIRAYSNDMKKAEELVQDMIANGIKPTDHTYKTLVQVLHRDFTINDKGKKLAEIRELYFASDASVKKELRTQSKN